MTEPITVAVADDQVLFCSGMEMLIRSQSDLAFSGAAHDGAAAIDLAQRAEPDVLLMDIRMPGLDGISATRDVVRRSPSTRVIVLTTHQRDAAVAEAISAGASGFLMKDASPEFLLATIRSVHAGSTVFSPPSPDILLHNPSQGGVARSDPLARLSEREREVFQLAARGLATAEIAKASFVTESTVKSHISSILAKLGLSSRLQLVAFAHTHNLVT